MGHPSKFQRVSLLHRRLSTEVNQTLHHVWPSPGLVHYTYTTGGSCPVTEFLTGAKFTLRPNLAFSYIGSVTARHSSSGRQPNFAAFSRQRHLGLHWTGSHHFGHRPTFLFFFPRLFSAVGNWISSNLPYFHTCGLSANLECRSEMCCTRLAEKYRIPKIAKIHHLCITAQY